MEEFTIETDDSEEIPILQAELDAAAMDENAESPEDREYLVGVEWDDTSSMDDAYWETGMYANQNTVTKLRNQFTIERLYDHRSEYDCSLSG